MRSRLRPALLVVVAVALAAVPASPEHARASLAAAPGGLPTAGAWIWTRADARLLATARASDPALRAAIHVATIERRPDGRYANRLALAPDAAGTDRDVAVVVRFDDSLNAAWDAEAEEGVASAVAPLLARVLALVDATGVRASEVQLDYDAPVRALDAWARVVGRLAAGPLQGRDTWVTSVPAHLEAAAYGPMFASAGVGHILQVFDTGLACTPEHASRLASRLTSAGLRFRVGVGGFERPARPGDHACWAAEAARWRKLPEYAGAWVFPAERDIRRTLAPFEAP